MQGTELKEMELGYLYYSLYSYRRKIEGEIKQIIRADKIAGQSGLSPNKQEDSAATLYELTRKLRSISMIISKLITLNKVYK